MIYPEWKRIRMAMGLTLRQVEEKTGLSNAYLSQLENGKIKKPSHEVVMKLNEIYLNHDPDKLRCPLCKSEDIHKDEKRSNNGIIGPGFSSWVIASNCVCRNCGIMFQPVKPKV